MYYNYVIVFKIRQGEVLKRYCKISMIYWLYLLLRVFISEYYFIGKCNHFIDQKNKLIVFVQ